MNILILLIGFLAFVTIGSLFVTWLSNGMKEMREQDERDKKNNERG